MRAVKGMVLNLKLDQADYDMAAEAGKRASAMFSVVRGETRPAADFSIDLAVTNNHGCPLDLAKLLAFDDFNFAHDVFGIMNHLDHETGKLGRCFVPRCAKRGAA